MTILLEKRKSTTPVALDCGAKKPRCRLTALAAAVLLTQFGHEALKTGNDPFDFVGVQSQLMFARTRREGSNESLLKPLQNVRSRSITPVSAPLLNRKVC